MNQCLTIPELLIEICNQCDNLTLAMLGRTAKLFDCALDVLWSGYNVAPNGINIWKLIECFPPELRTGRLLVQGSITAQHWDRFNFYAKRVKAFYLDLHSLDQVSLANLAYAHPGNLLPNLKSLTYYWHHQDELFLIRGFMGPTLQDLDIIWSAENFNPRFPSPSTVDFLLAPLLSICTGITRLCLRFPGMASDDFMLPLFGGLRNLRSLELKVISTRHLPLVLSLPQLSDLTLQNIMNSSVFLPPVSAPTCHALKRLNLRASNKHILALFALLPRCPLECIGINLFSAADPNEFAQIARMVKDKCQTHSLRTLSIYETLDEETLSYVTGDHFSPFFDFPNITTLGCFSFKSLFVDDTFISALAASWSNLTDLQLPVPRLGFNPPGFPIATAKSLALLAFHCPRLLYCRLEFDGASTGLDLLKDLGEDQDGKLIRDTCNPSLQMLDVGYSPITDPESVAEYLHSLFPNICHISLTVHYSMPLEAKEVYLDRWKRVALLLGINEDKVNEDFLDD